MSWLSNIFRFRESDAHDAFAEEIVKAMGGFRDDVQSFTQTVQDFGLGAQIAELNRRIDALEKAIHPLRNGVKTHT